MKEGSLAGPLAWARALWRWLFPIPFAFILAIVVALFHISVGLLGAWFIMSSAADAAAHRHFFLWLGLALFAGWLIISVMGRQGAAFIARQQEAQEQRIDLTWSAISHILDLRDHGTAGHSQRVRDMASLLGAAMGLSKEELRVLRQAARVHDIGKIALPDSVLFKNGRLSEEEWQLMRQHPTLGYKLCKSIPILEPAAEIVYAHHERYDGRGYPRGLKGEEIPLGARIFAVIDAYDAMTSDRPYRRALGHDYALAEIERNAGTQFDPQVVATFLKLARQGLISPIRHPPAAVARALVSESGA